MRYIKTYENDTRTDTKFKIGDYVKCMRPAWKYSLFKIVKIHPEGKYIENNYLCEVVDDLLEPGDIGYRMSWFESELINLTTDEFEDFFVRKDMNKYNL